MDIKSQYLVECIWIWIICRSYAVATTSHSGWIYYATMQQSQFTNDPN